MATPTGTMPGCICPTATYPLPLPTASAPLQSFWAPATLGIWAGSIASIFILIYTIVKVAPSRRAKLFGMDETILQLSLRALLTPQEQWRLARMVEEREHYAQWLPKYLWWALWHTEPPIPPVVVVNLGEELEQQPEEEQQEERHGWTLNNGGLPTFVEMRHPRPTTMRRRRDRQSLSWHTDPPS